METAKNHGIPNAYVHFFGDGRDTNPRSSDKYLEQLQKTMNDLNYGQVATVIGRYYAMDRDKRWERIKIAFEALTQGVGEKSRDPLNVSKCGLNLLTIVLNISLIFKALTLYYRQFGNDFQKTKLMNS